MPADDDTLAPLVPEFFVPDVKTAISFYVEKLGFRVVREEPGFAVVLLGDAFVMLAHEARYGQPLSNPPGIAVDLRFMVPDVDAMYRRCLDNGVEVLREIQDQDYGLRDFTVRDPTGFRLRFASPLR